MINNEMYEQEFIIMMMLYSRRSLTAETAYKEMKEIYVALLVDKQPKKWRSLLISSVVFQ